MLILFNGISQIVLRQDFANPSCLLKVSFLRVQIWLESNGPFFDCILLSAGQSEESISNLFRFEVEKGMCDRFCWIMCIFKPFLRYPRTIR